MDGVERRETRIRQSCADLMFSTRCGGCGEIGDACCRDCLASFAHPRRIARNLIDHRIPTFALASYRGNARRTIVTYKERGRRDMAGPLGRALAASLRAVVVSGGVGFRFDSVSIVPAPSRPTASRVRGGAHVTRLARYCAAQIRATGGMAAARPALRLGAGVRDAMGLSRAERIDNLSGKMLISERHVPPANSFIVLIDDVVTTGATVAVCVTTLASIGSPVSAVIALAATAQ